MFSGGKFASLEVANVICAPAFDKATSNIIKISEKYFVRFVQKLFSDGVSNVNGGDC